MDDVLLVYRACEAETRDDWLRMLANDNGLPLAVVTHAADGLGMADVEALVAFCESTGAETAQ